MDTETVPVPDVTVAHYDAPVVTITPVTEVIPSEPLAGRTDPGHYQHVLLNTVTGELSFHESTEHREPWRPEWRSMSDVPRDIWNRWHPGTHFSFRGPHMWFQPVPELLTWTIDSGNYVTELPYLDVAAANALLERIAPQAAVLLDSLAEAGGELDWSATAACAGRNIGRLCSRRPELPKTEIDTDLVDFSVIVRQFPQVFNPKILTKPLDKLAEACETVTRFLGCNEHWHPEILDVFGVPYSDGSGRTVEVLGVRSWYRTVLLDGDPRVPRDFADWDARLGRLTASAITSRSTDAELDAWAEREQERAAQANVLLVGARDAAEQHRARLRDTDWDQLAIVGAEVARLERELDEARARRLELTSSVIRWNRSDAAIAERARMTRQNVHKIRTGESSSEYLSDVR